MKKIFIILSMLCMIHATSYDYKLITKESASATNDANATKALIIAGIQGDESGGYNALDIFLRHYEIISGVVNIIPSLNVYSMIHNNRGVYGDMNRKFAAIDPKDKDYDIIQSIKKEILKNDAIFHLHDGSGFYRDTYISSMLNPKRWGNCSIIDQEKLKGAKFEDLDRIINNIVEHINKHKLKELHTYHVKNTHTRGKDKEMEKSLTFFAVENNVSAFANEASKSLPLREKVYYHLLGIEGFLHNVGIEFKRDFELNPHVLASLINDTNLSAKIEDLNILPVLNLRDINYFPMPLDKNKDINIESKSNILTITPSQREEGKLDFKYGNRLMSRISPFYVEFDSTLVNKEIKVRLDDIEKNVKIGEILDIKDSFEIASIDGYRVNIIGYVSPNTDELKDESSIKITQNMLMNNFSVDIHSKIYRIEFYNDKLYSGMILVRFIN